METLVFDLFANLGASGNSYLKDFFLNPVWWKLTESSCY